MIFDPLLLVSIMFFQIGNRFLKIETTKAQEKILTHPYVQFCLYFILIYYSTRDIFITVIIVSVSCLFLFVLFNEKNKYHILSEKWLKNEDLLVDKKNDIVNTKETYKTNLDILHK